MEIKKYYCTQYLARHHLELFNVDLALRGFILKPKFFYSPFEAFETQMHLNEKSPSSDFVKGLAFVKKFLCCTDQHKQKFSKKLKVKSSVKFKIKRNTNLKINAEFPLVKFHYFVFNIVKFISKKELGYNARYSGLSQIFRLQYSNLDELSLFDKFSYFGWKGSLIESIAFKWRTQKNRAGIVPIFLSIYKIYKK